MTFTRRSFGAVVRRALLSLPAAGLILAASLGRAFAQAPPATPTASTIFGTQNPQDYGIAWLNYLFNNQPFMSANLYGGAVQTAFQTLLRAYSYGVLVIASFLLLYYLVAIVAETAHTGKPGGRANQLWGPIRAVLAIGLLIPTPSGMNSGQYVIVSLAQNGSNLASYAWNQFYDAFENVNLTAQHPPSPDVATVVGQMYQDAFCLDAFQVLATANPQMNISVPAPVTRNPSFLGIVTEPGTLIEDFNVTINGKTIQRACGGMTYIVNPCGLFEGQAACSAELATQAAQSNVGQTEFNYILGELMPIAESIIPGGTTYQTTLPDNTMVLNDINNYETTLAANITDSVFPENNCTEENANGAVGSSSCTPYGWMSAPLLFNSIAAQQAEYFTVVGQLPSFERAKFSVYGANDPLFAMVAKGDLSMAIWMSSAAATPPIAQQATPSEDDSDVSKVVTAVSAAAMRSNLWGNGGSFFSNLINSGSATTSQEDAISSLTDLGRRHLHMSLLLFGAAAGTSIGGALLGAAGSAISVAAAAAGTGAEIGAGIGSVEPGAGTAIGGVGGAVIGAVGVGGASFVGAAFSALSKLSVPAETLLITLGGIGLFAAVMLGFVLPLVPFVKFMMGILTWLVALMEAVIAIPLFAIAHLNPDGEGVLPAASRAGYFMILQVIIRPILMVIGLIVSLMLINSMVAFLNSFFVPAVLSTYQNDAPGIIAKFIFMIIYDVLAYSIATSCFKVIDIIPNNALRWMGGQHADTHFEEQHISSAAAAIAGSQAIGMVQRGIGGTRQAVQGHFKGKQDQADEAAKERSMLAGEIRSANPNMSTEMVERTAMGLQAERRNIRAAAAAGTSINRINGTLAPSQTPPPAENT